MIVTLVAAVADNGVIGVAGGLPWRLPADLRHFKMLTSGHAVIMGRRTYDEIGTALPRRRNIVVTRNRDFSAEKVEAVPSLDAALALVADAEEVFVIGGGQLYAVALPRADRMVLTRVHGTPDGDTRFPDVPWAEWELASAERHPADDGHAYPFTIERWVRRS